MKKTILLLSLLSITIVTKESENNKSIVLDKNKVFHAVCFSMIDYESQFIADTTNKNSDAVGLVQTRCIMVDEINRKFKFKKYTYEDRLNPVKSYQMLLDFQLFYNKERNLEKTAKTWHGGPNGMYKTSTIGYWNQIKLRLKNRLTPLEYTFFIGL
jgi:hypothetical protein